MRNVLKSSVWAIAVPVISMMLAVAAFAGDPDTPTGAPTDPASAMYTLENIYQRLATGAAGTKRVGPFDEPTSGPGATGYTLDEIMGLAPAIDAAGATAGDVMTGKKFWGLTAGAWGLKTGTLACAATSTGDATAGDVLATKTFSNSSSNGIGGSMPNNGAFGLSCGASNQTVTAGYTSGGTLTGDADLVDGNIKSGVNIFGVVGTFSCGAAATGDAVAADVLTGKTFSNGTSSGIAGGMTDNGAVTITPGATAKPIPAGYHNGSGTVATDANLTAANIVSGKTIFGVAGSASAATSTAPVPKTGQTACYNNSATPVIVPCPFAALPGQDGDNQKGVALPSPRFTKNGDGTVTDNLTGLIWLKNANCGGFRTWAQALNDVVSLNSSGAMNGNNCGDTGNHTDWRLPNRSELASLIHVGYVNPALSNTLGTAKWAENDPFDNVVVDKYWSATTVASTTTSAWHVQLTYGDVLSGGKTLSRYVWPVRGGQ